MLGTGVEVIGSIRWQSRTENIERLRSKIQLVESDLRYDGAEPANVDTGVEISIKD